jgi:hypothetical protein
MQTFSLNLHRGSDPGLFIAYCNVRGEQGGVEPANRTFSSESELIAALIGNGINPLRYQPALEAVRSGSDASFEINLNEAQRLDILHIDSTE